MSLLIFECNIIYRSTLSIIHGRRGDGPTIIAVRGILPLRRREPVLRRRRQRSTRRRGGNRRARGEHNGISYNLRGIVEFTAAYKVRVIPENFRATNDVGWVFFTKETRITTTVPAVDGSSDEYFKKA